MLKVEVEKPRSPSRMLSSPALSSKR